MWSLALAWAGFLGLKYNPFHTGDPNKPDFSVRDLNLPMGVEWARMEGRFSLKNLVESRIKNGTRRTALKHSTATTRMH